MALQVAVDHVRARAARIGNAQPAPTLVKCQDDIGFWLEAGREY